MPSSRQSEVELREWNAPTYEMEAKLQRAECGDDNKNNQIRGDVAHTLPQSMASHGERSLLLGDERGWCWRKLVMHRGVPADITHTLLAYRPTLDGSHAIRPNDSLTTAFKVIFSIYVFVCSSIGMACLAMLSLVSLSVVRVCFVSRSTLCSTSHSDLACWTLLLPP